MGGVVGEGGVGGRLQRAAPKALLPLLSVFL